MQVQGPTKFCIRSSNFQKEPENRLFQGLKLLIWGGGRVESDNR